MERKCRYCGGPVEAHMKMDRCKACKKQGKGRKKAPAAKAPRAMGKRRARDARFEEIYAAAHDSALMAGRLGFEMATPMVVQQHANPFDDGSPVVKEWGPIAGGCCGFAWVNVYDRAFCNWLKRTGRSTDASSRYSIWVTAFGQSLEAKEAYARAFAAVLVKHGIRATAGSRMD